MKRTIIASIIGVAACAAVNSYGQGNLIFVNYSFGSSSYSAPVTFGGQAVGSDFTAQLLYSSSGTAGTFSPVVGATSQFYGTGLGDTADGGGLFGAVPAQVSPYTTGAAYFEIEAYNTDVVSGHAADTIVGTSGIFEYSVLATAANLHTAGDPFADNPDVLVPLSQSGFSVIVSTPEPTTLALLGLGVASLVAFRRKQV
ncbi:MAG TPA: PEP-CTERM sorting domain-containing protein [Verrucomicrobiae bacterium]|jgi:hypothetical protein